ncbi:hypothetical protein IGI04_022800 [Brassica rapa subsp. trilocularis]|uniref:Uncharacterized protein n=1 Tax=Brassica rapa subsp. trilocularis TaxID=1813537 RepID=A0ABQ7M1Z6_BRACM|nr:hypothetical protein IGI04_022800 [Brassica rapa subsp. trilocularis]
MDLGQLTIDLVDVDEPGWTVGRKYNSWELGITLDVNQHCIRRLQGADCNDKETPRVATLRDRIGEDRDAPDLLPGLQKYPYTTSVQPVFCFFS